MKRLLIFAVLFFSMLGSQLFAQKFYKSLEPNEKQMVVYVGSYDWGACIEKVVINIGNEIEPKKVRKKDFSITRRFYSKEANMGLGNAALTLTDAYTSDSQGNRSSKAEKYITIETDVYPTAENSNPFVNMIASGVFEKYYSYKVDNEDLGISISNLRGFVNEPATRFKENIYCYNYTGEKEGQDIELRYLSYVPKSKKSDKKIPLILWFHGIGESGSNPYTVIFGTKASALAGDKIQSYFEDGAAILAPQCPTGWLETTDEMNPGIRYWSPVDINGTIQKVANPVVGFLSKFINAKPAETKPFAAVSFYTEPVTGLLLDFLEEHEEIDRDRIYVGGCSAGGYMTMNMMIEHPELFAAAFPICEYYLNSKITNAQINTLVNKPFWFTYAVNDGAVKPGDNSIPTIKRLRSAGAKNIKVSEFPNVVDTSGKYPLNRNADEDDDDYGLPFEYTGHSSWIYVLNDECRDEDGVSLFKWLSKQKLNVEK